MMFIPCLALLLLVIGTNGDANHVPLRLIEGFEGQLLRSRAHRSTGVAKINKLLKHSKHIFSDGLNDVYVRQGTFGQALEDFKALSPEKIKDTKRFGKARAQGKIGRRRIVVEETNSGPRLTITELPERNAIRVDPVIVKTIVYIEKTGP